MTVRDAAHQKSHSESLGSRGDESERGVALEHGLFGGPKGFHLEPVVHHRQRSNTERLGGLRQVAQCRSDGGRSAGPGESRYVEIEVHCGSFVFETSWWVRRNLQERNRALL